MDEVKIFGIIVSKLNDLPKYHVWCKEAYAGLDGVLIANSEDPVEVGDWVQITFNENDYGRYFSLDRRVRPPRFEATAYVKVPELYETWSEGGKIKVQLFMALEENQMALEHPIFGRIYNTSSLQFGAGRFTITIRRIFPAGRDSVWILHQVKEKPRAVPITIIGIVVSHDKGLTYVWCKERLPGKDIIMTTYLPLKTWIKFTVDQSNFDKFFPSEMPRDGHLGNYEIKDYDEIEEIHPTTVSGKEGKTVYIELELFLERNDKIEDIEHPFVGKIINESHQFDQSGIYSITIYRFKPKTGIIRSVWFLKTAFLKVEPSAQPVPVEPNLEQPATGPPIDDFSRYPILPGNNDNQA